VAIVIAVAATLLFTDLSRYAKTVALILRVTPYEQAGTGAGEILILGDSTGYGTGAKMAGQSVAGRLGAAYPGYRISNNSVNSRQIAGARDAAQKLTSQYNLVLLQIGANDLLAGRSVAEVVADMQQLIEAVLPHAEQVVIMTAGNIGALPRYSGETASYHTERSRAYTTAMVELTASYQEVAYVPLFDEPAEDPFVSQPERYIAWDGLHPSSAGYELWYQKALPYLRQALGLPAE